MVLEGWADAIQVLIEGNDDFGQEYGDSEEPKKQSSAVIIQFPDNV